MHKSYLKICLYLQCIDSWFRWKPLINYQILTWRALESHSIRILHLAGEFHFTKYLKHHMSSQRIETYQSNDALHAIWEANQNNREQVYSARPSPSFHWGKKSQFIEVFFMVLISGFTSHLMIYLDFWILISISKMLHFIIDPCIISHFSGKCEP